jgi:hypothetical protein
MCKLTDLNLVGLLYKGRFVPVSSETPSHEDVWGSAGIAIGILSLRNKHRHVVSFTTRPF